LLVFADRFPVRIAELCEEISQGVIIELELAFEQAIRDAAAPLKHGNCLVQDLLKGHRPPSLGR
jgi:hypothetical protein